MSFLLDTNVVSEWVKPNPNSGVVQWLDAVDEDRTFLSVMTIAELKFGVARLPDGQRKDRLVDWVTVRLPERFERRILDVNGETAQLWGTLMADRQRAGRPAGAMDGFIAATAHQHGLTLVTRNVGDFVPFGIDVLNPWASEE